MLELQYTSKYVDLIVYCACITHVSVDGRRGAEDDVLEVGHEVEVERLRWSALQQRPRRVGRARLIRHGSRRRARSRRRIEPLVFQNASEQKVRTK